MKNNVPRRVALTPRDIHLLEKLYLNVVLSFPQLWRMVFAGRAKPTVLNRLGRLENLGVIERWRVPLINYARPERGILVVFQIKRRGIRVLEEHFPGRRFRDKPVRLHGHSIHHDVLLVDVMEALELRFPGSRVTHGRLVEAPPDGGKTVEPDAVLELNGGQERWAVELELHAKSERRYREIGLRYRLARHVTRVLYVSGRREIGHKLARVLDGKLEVLGATLPKERFLVVDLHALLPEKNKTDQSQQMATFHQPKGEISA